MNNKLNLNEDVFKAIVIDRDNNNFKVVTGDYKDKKELSDNYVDEYVIRKVYRQEVFNWILENAKSPLDAYILLSTSYRKWVNKDITKNYYYKIKKDLPILSYKESGMEDLVRRLVEEASQEVNEGIKDWFNKDKSLYTQTFTSKDIPQGMSEDEFIDQIFNNPMNHVELFTKKFFGGKADSEEVNVPNHDGYEEVFGTLKHPHVHDAINKFRDRNPDKKIYYSKNGGKPELLPQTAGKERRLTPQDILLTEPERN